MNKIYITIGVVVIVVLAAVGIYKAVQPSRGSQVIACTMEAKLCPNGSFIGRSGPNCEFSACPTSTSTSITKTGSVTGLNEKVLLNGLNITPLMVIEDSRCAEDVQCVWAGQVKVKVRLESASSIKELIMTTGTTTTFAGKDIRLEGVSPVRNSKSTAPLDYRFTFSVKNSVPITVVSTGTITGTVTTSPTCPVERMPPDPACAPRGYQTTINIFETGKNVLLKTIYSDVAGKFSTKLNPGSYDLKATDAPVYPRCNSITVNVKAGVTSVSDISCDSGIR